MTLTEISVKRLRELALKKNQSDLEARFYFGLAADNLIEFLEKKLKEGEQECKDLKAKIRIMKRRSD